MWIVCTAQQTIHIKCQDLLIYFLWKKKKEIYLSLCFKVKHFLIYCTATAHKRINVTEIVFYSYLKL